MICGLGMARRDWIMRALLGEQPPPGARAGTYCVDILCGHRIWRSRNWGRRLILGVRFAGCRDFTA